jgi:hypothetical protein
VLNSEAVTRSEVLKNLNRTYMKMKYDHKVFTGHSKKISNISEVSKSNEIT